MCLLDEENITLREESNDVVEYLIPSRPEGLRRREVGVRINVIGDYPRRRERGRYTRRHGHGRRSVGTWGCRCSDIVGHGHVDAENNRLGGVTLLGVEVKSDTAVTNKGSNGMALVIHMEEDPLALCVGRRGQDGLDKAEAALEHLVDR